MTVGINNESDVWILQYEFFKFMFKVLYLIVDSSFSKLFVYVPSFDSNVYGAI
jgi:hypothetical protein